jgi:hypothetical protein
MAGAAALITRCAYNTRNRVMTFQRTPVAILCIALVLCAAFTAGTVAHSVAIVLERVWPGFVPPARVFVPPQVVRVDEQARALLSIFVSRPPPILA